MKKSLFYGVVFVNGPWTEYSSLFVMIQSVLVFNFLAQGNYEKTSKKTRRVLAYMSEWTLGAYLISFIFDAVFYTPLRESVPAVVDQLIYFPIIVPAVYIASLLVSGILNVLQRYLGCCIKAVRRKLQYNAKMKEDIALKDK